MTRYQDIVPASQDLATLEEIDFVEMENVTGGCSQCLKGGSRNTSPAAGSRSGNGTGGGGRNGTGGGQGRRTLGR